MKKEVNTTDENPLLYWELHDNTEKAKWNRMKKYFYWAVIFIAVCVLGFHAKEIYRQNSKPSDESAVGVGAGMSEEVETEVGTSYTLVAEGYVCDRSSSVTYTLDGGDGWARKSAEDCQRLCDQNAHPNGRSSPPGGECKFVIWDDNRDWPPGWCQLAISCEPSGRIPIRSSKIWSKYPMKKCDFEVNGKEWHDSDGPYYNCAWYAQGSNCRSFGHRYRYAGYTANQVCCACKAGTSIEASVGGSTHMLPNPRSSKAKSSDLKKESIHATKQKVTKYPEVGSLDELQVGSAPSYDVELEVGAAVNEEEMNSNFTKAMESSDETALGTNYDIGVARTNCAPGYQITDINECERAFAKLGLKLGNQWRRTWTHEKQDYGTPGGCSVRSTRSDLHYNAVLGEPNERGDLKPVCKRKQGRCPANYYEHVGHAARQVRSWGCCAVCPKLKGERRWYDRYSRCSNNCGCICQPDTASTETSLGNMLQGVDDPELYAEGNTTASVIDDPNLF